MPLKDQPAIVTGTLYNNELKYSGGGVPFCKFSIGKGKSKKNKQTGQFEPDGMVFYNCMVFGPEAEVVGQATAKDTRIQAALEFDQSEFQDKTTGENRRSDKFMVRKILEIGPKPQYNNNGQHQPQQQNQGYQQQPQQQNQGYQQQQPPQKPQQNQAAPQGPNAYNQDLDFDIPF